MMASPNVELVRSIYAAWSRGDYSAAEWAHPDIEYVYAGGPEPGSWTGRAHMADTWRDFLRAWADFRSEAGEYRELDDSRVLVLIHNRGHGKTSGIGVGELARAASLFEIHDGKVTRLVVYFNRELAFAELGLPS